MEEIIRVADAGMYVSKHKGGDLVSTVEELSEGETNAVRRQLISSYIEGFLQREHTGPEHVDELIATLKKMCGEGERNTQALREAIEALTRASESREASTSGHGEMVGRYSEILARSLGWSPDEIRDLAFAARVHDVGKIFISEQVLNESSPRTEQETNLLKWHAWVGREVVATLPDSKKLQEAVQYHHEWFDGTGYPEGLRGDRIPLWARIIAIADAYVNMTTERPFAAAKTSEQALAELEKLSGTRFDGMLVRMLIRELKIEKATNWGS
jgi:HD-GYP domain-containing protein (c-di-GMP phosphodiesterase class II)